MCSLPAVRAMQYQAAGKSAGNADKIGSDSKGQYCRRRIGCTTAGEMLCNINGHWHCHDPDVCLMAYFH